MEETRKVIPGHQAVGYILGACLVLIPLFAYRDAVELFGSPGALHLVLIVAGGGAVSCVALAERGDRMLALFPGLVGGACVALVWDTLLHSSFGASFVSGNFKVIVPIGIGAVPGAVLFRLLKFVRKVTWGVAQNPECPVDWNRTIDDLFSEMKAGKRKHVGQPEIEWAREYEKRIIPEGTRFPKKGDVYESKTDKTVHYMTAWSAPFTGGGEATLLKGERIWIDNDPNEERPIGTYALPIEYDELEKRMVPLADRQAPKYGGFYFHFKTVDLNTNFTLVQIGYDGKGEQTPAGDVLKAAPEK